MIQQQRLGGSPEDTEFYEKIAQDIKQTHIQFISEAGHGKSSSLKTILKYCKEKHPEIVFKIFDLSLAWWHNAPTTHRQTVTVEKLGQNRVANINDCVYDVGNLPEEVLRTFIASIIQQDYDMRYQLAKNDPKALEEMPFVIFVFEEADICFGSYSMRKNDEAKDVFKKFSSIGRNLRMRSFLVATAEIGEISPGFRRRSRKIYGQLISRGDINEVKKDYKELAGYLRNAPKYHFAYIRGGTDGVFGPVKIPDLVKTVPTDYEYEPGVVVTKPNDWETLLKYAGVTIFVLWVFLSAIKNGLGA